MILLETLLVAGAGYFLGSISFAVLIARAHGVDIFASGSGNPGATNVKRAVGSRAGNLCFLLDAMKGFIAAAWPQLPAIGLSHPGLFGVIGLTAAILGHSFSIFIRFRGGKGVATTVGGLLALMPAVVLIGMVVWLITFQLCRYVSLASIALGLSLPVSAFALSESTTNRVLALLVAVLIVLRHRANIARLRAGTESRFAAKRKTPG